MRTWDDLLAFDRQRQAEAKDPERVSNETLLTILLEANAGCCDS